MKHHSATTPGSLYIVATPIGNLQDMTFRAIEVLKEATLILAEDTRHAKKLLSSYGITTPLQSFHAHNESVAANQIIPRLQAGDVIALISDAGTPLIQDPGFPLVRLAIQANLSVIPIPGACALITALCASGIACDTFLFAGFLPAKAQSRKERLISYQHSPHAVIFYESTHRILSTISAIQEVYGESHTFVLAKELTKTFETFIRGNASLILAFLNENPAHTKGEFVLILPPNPLKKEAGEDEKLLSILLAHLPLKQAITIAEKLTDTPKNTLYKQALTLQQD